MGRHIQPIALLPYLVEAPSPVHFHSLKKLCTSLAPLRFSMTLAYDGSNPHDSRSARITYSNGIVFPNGSFLLHGEKTGRISQSLDGRYFSELLVYVESVDELDKLTTPELWDKDPRLLWSRLFSSLVYMFDTEGVVTINGGYVRFRESLLVPIVGSSAI